MMKIVRRNLEALREKVGIGVDASRHDEAQARGRGPELSRSHPRPAAGLVVTKIPKAGR
jgi:hypothetical protein